MSGFSLAFNVQLGDGRTVVASVALGDGLTRDAGEWWLRPEAVALERALDAALAPPAPAVCSALIHDLLLAVSGSAALVKHRVVHSSDDTPLDPLRQEWVPHGPQQCDASDGALLTHTLDWPWSRGGDDAPRTCELRTLVCALDGAPDVQQAVFPGGVTFAASEAHQRSACAVSLCGGTLLSEGDVACLPPLQRAHLKRCWRAQVLHAMRACLQRRWLGGVKLLRGVATPLLDAAVVTDALTPLLAALAALPLGGQPRALASAAPPSGTTLVRARTHQAEALEDLGRFAEAAALYKANLAEEMRSPGVLPCVPTMWSYLGIALRRSGDAAAAKQAYERGIAVLGSCPLDPDTSAHREALRIHLFQRLLRVTGECDVGRVSRRLFAGYLTPQDARALAFNSANGDWIEALDSGRRWGVVYGEDSTFYKSMLIAELPQRVGPPHADPGSEEALDIDTGAFVLVSDERDGVGGKQQQKMQGQPTAVKLQPLLGKCAACGAVRCHKRCACNLVAYCDAQARRLLLQLTMRLHSVLRLTLLHARVCVLQCQATHRKQHKQACRQAMQAQRDGATASGA
jgi:hypothetical protein